MAAFYCTCVRRLGKVRHRVKADSPRRDLTSSPRANPPLLWDERMVLTHTTPSHCKHCEFRLFRLWLAAAGLNSLE